jgi:HEAT repeat protein
MVAAAMLAAPEAAPAQTVRDQIDEYAQRDIEALKSVLARPTAANDLEAQVEKEEAAKRLVSRGSVMARQALYDALLDVGNPGSQYAAAIALAGDPKPDPQFVTPLFTLLGADARLTEAAAAALGNYKTNPDVLGRLSSMARSDRPREVRIAVIKALGTLLDRAAAETLINLLLNTDEHLSIRTAAADALAMMTGLRENNHDPQLWRLWWEANRNKDDIRWRASLLDSRAARFDQVNTRLREATTEISRLLTAQYGTVLDQEKRRELLMQYLKSSEPTIRATGARIVANEAIQSVRHPASIRNQIIAMVGDSSTDVRLAIAQTLYTLNEDQALDALLSQLAQEQDGQVRTAIVKALAPIGSAKAIPMLLRVLETASPQSATAAAEALEDMGREVIAKDPQLAARVAAALRTAYAQRNDPALANLRQAIVEATVPIRDTSDAMREFYFERLRPSDNSPVGIRVAALRGLGELGDKRTADFIVQTALSDRNETIRLEAVRALSTTATFEQANALFERLSDESEVVRKQAWDVLWSLFPLATKEQLNIWQGRFVEQPERQLRVLQVLAQRQQEDNDHENYAYTQQRLGETYMKLTPSDPARAANHFFIALSYWESRGDEGMVTLQLIRDYFRALLDSRQYDKAAEFAATRIAKDVKLQDDFGSLIRDEVQDLEKASRDDDALKLIEEAGKMNPSLDARYTSVLEQTRTRIMERRQKDPATDGPQSAQRPLDGNST